ncbi:MAG: RNA-binding protein [Aestuariivirga sp.]
MPKGPKGEKRPADVIGNAVKVMRIAVGDEDEKAVDDRSAASQRGGIARALKISPERRTEIARKAAAKRWGAKGS